MQRVRKAVIPAAGFVALKKRFRNIDFDDMYILHNHPDRDNAVSPADLSIAAGYYKTFGSRFKGSIVLEKTGFQILKPIGPSSPFSRKVDLLPLSFMYENQPWKEHDPGPAQRLDDKDMGYDGRLADWIRKNSGSWPVCRSIVEGRASGAAVAYMDTERRLIDFQPFDAEFGFPSQIAESTVRKRAASATLVTGDPRLYEKLKKKAMSESKHKRSPVRDIILVLPGNYRSMRQENRKYRSSDPRDTIPTKRFNDIIRNEGRNVVVDTGVISITEKLRRKAVKESGSRTGRKGNERI